MAGRRFRSRDTRRQVTLTDMKILLVDDHVLFRDGITLLPKRLVAGDSLYQAGTCEEALALVARDPSIELVLMDINLPGTSGINAISLIRAFVRNFRSFR
jgi:DNA-binding NarL/FixJ family response regulator